MDIFVVLNLGVCNRLKLLVSVVIFSLSVFSCVVSVVLVFRVVWIVFIGV